VALITVAAKANTVLVLPLYGSTAAAAAAP